MINQIPDYECLDSLISSSPSLGLPEFPRLRDTEYASSFENKISVDEIGQQFGKLNARRLLQSKNLSLFA